MPHVVAISYTKASHDYVYYIIHLNYEYYIFKLSYPKFIYCQSEIAVHIILHISYKYFVVWKYFEKFVLTEIVQKGRNTKNIYTMGIRT